MMMKPESIPPIQAPIGCGNCGADERRLLHHVRHRGIFRRLCITCVLRLHPQSFCPTCYIVYDRPPPPSNDVVSCFKCYSSSHSQCVGPNAQNPYVCPPCQNPSAPIFSAKKVKDEEGNSCREIDKKSARVLLAAAKIAASSMNKAAVAARAEAERRAKEAAFTRKRAREALEHVAFLVAKEKLKRKDNLLVEVSGSGNVNGVDGPNEVSARLNAVGLREKERLQRFGGNSAVPRALGNDASVMGVDDKDRIRVNPGANVGGAFEKSGNVGPFENKNALGGKANNGLHHAQNKIGSEGNLGP